MERLTERVAQTPESIFEELKGYVGFGDGEVASLLAAEPLLQSALPAIIDDFYASILRHTRAHLLITGGPAQVDRLKTTLNGWIRELFGGSYGDAYVRRRARIGRIHLDLGMPQHYMLGAMNVIRVGLQRALRTSVTDPARLPPMAAAIDRILDLELALMLHVYHEDAIDRAQAAERKLAEAERERLRLALDASERRHEEVLEAVEALILVCEPNGTVQFINRHAELVTGFPRDALVGQSWLSVLVPPDARDATAALLRRVATHRRTVAQDVALVDAKGQRRSIRWVLRPGEDLEAPSIIYALGTDVTDINELEARARVAERLAAVGTLSAGLAHEIRNPLNAALLLLQVLGREVRKAPPGTGDRLAGPIELASQELQRLERLLSDFLAFARPSELELRLSDLRPELTRQAQLFELLALEKRVQLRLALPGEPLVVRHDASRLGQVLNNLLANALEATPGGGRVSLRGLRVDDAVLIEVEDSGHGIPPELVGRVFDPFFTTKEGGTGLGLAIAHSIVQLHGGTIHIEPPPEGGTRMTIRLPLP